jgi:Na+/H+ antiporter NhaD/arsenite permease-like protein
MVPLIKTYVVSAGLTSRSALSTGANTMSPEALAFFLALMFGVTPGGKCAQAGSRISFGRFLRYGIPVGLCQLFVAALYVSLKLYWR